MKQVYGIISALWCIWISAPAQIYVEGRLVDEKNREPLVFIEIYARAAGHSDILAGILSDEAGFFVLTLPSAVDYDLYVYQLGREQHIGHIDRRALASGRLSLGTIKVQQPVYRLSEVNVVSDIGATRVEPGKIVFRAEDLPVAQGGTAGDLLKLMPSVSMGGPPGVPRDVRYRGLDKAYTLVLINGRNMGIVGNNREVLVNQIPASAVERIEIISSPGPEFDGDGISGVVNIILKKGTYESTGIHAMIDAYYDNRGGYNLAADVNQRFRRWQLSAGYARNRALLQGRFAMRENDWRTTFRDGNIDGYQFATGIEERDILSETFKTGIRWMPSARSVIGVDFLLGKQQEAKLKSVDNTRLRTDSTFRDRSLQLNDDADHVAFWQLSADYKLHLPKGGYLESYVQHVRSPQYKPRFRTQQRLDAQGQALNNQPILERQQEDVLDENWFAQTMLFLPLSHRIQLKAGYKFQGRMRSAQQQREVYNYQSGHFEPRGEAGGRNFRYREDIHAAFVDYTYYAKRLTAGLGYRHEYVYYQSMNRSDTSTQQGAYHLPLPTLRLNYNIDSTQYVKLSVGRRVRRPSMQDMTPFRDDSDPTKIKEGNPDLKPELAWAYELGYMKTFRFWEIGANLFQRDLFSVIQKEIIDLGDGITLERQANLLNARVQGLELITALRPFSFLAFNINYGRFRSSTDEGDALQDQFDWSLKMIADLRWQAAGVWLQAAYNAIGAKNTSVRQEEPIEFWEFAINKSLWADKLLFNLRAIDPFLTNRKVRTETTPNVERYRVQEAPGRWWSIGVSYRF